jgi:hypothetical protein
MKKFALVTLVTLAAITIVALTITANHGSRARTASAAQTAAQTNGQILEGEIQVKELKCENELIGKTSHADAHDFCHGLRRSDWEEWAIQFPELAKAREAVAR